MSTACHWLARDASHRGRNLSGFASITGIPRYTVRMSRTAIDISTDDGTCPASLFRPAGPGPWPVVLMYMDGIGIRAALFDVAELITASGYAVLVPDLFYRAGVYTAPDPATLFSDPAVRAAWFGKYASTASPDNVMRDTRAFLAYLSAQRDLLSDHIGVVGFCMGGGLALRAAGTYPGQIAAAASFHGGNLVTDAETSPHLVAPEIRARVYVAGAIEDASFPDAMKARLEQALSDGGVVHTIETYPARHGWMMSDTPVYDAVAAERGLVALKALLDATLPAPGAVRAGS